MKLTPKFHFNDKIFKRKIITSSASFKNSSNTLFSSGECACTWRFWIQRDFNWTLPWWESSLLRGAFFWNKKTNTIFWFTFMDCHLVNSFHNIFVFLVHVGHSWVHLSHLFGHITHLKNYHVILHILFCIPPFYSVLPLAGPEGPGLSWLFSPNLRYWIKDIKKIFNANFTTGRVSLWVLLEGQTPAPSSLGCWSWAGWWVDGWLQTEPAAAPSCLSWSCPGSWWGSRWGSWWGRWVQCPSSAPLHQQNHQNCVENPVIKSLLTKLTII